MTHRALLSFAAVVILGAAGLVLAVANDQRATAFSAGVPSAGPVLALAPGQQVCQGPMLTPATFAGLAVWVTRVRARAATLAVTVTGAGSPPASGSARASSPARLNIRLDHPVPAGPPVSVCFHNLGPGSEWLVGSTPRPASGALHQAGQPPVLAAALVALAPRSRSLLSMMPTIFRRAALFHPTWVGAWTFWLMLAALIAAVALAGVALGQAAREDELASDPRAPAPSTPPAGAPRSRP